MKRRPALPVALLASCLSALGETTTPPSVPYLSPEEELATFRLPPGYRMKLVVSDPVIQEPVAIAFDGNGRMFVAEMRAFMRDLDGTDERAKNGRISLHWSSKGDEAEKSFLALGEVGYRSLCFACHGIDGTGTPLEGGAPGATLAPPLAGANLVLGPPQQSALVLLHGLTGPIEGRTYPTQMIPMATNSDRWIASVLSYVRNSFGNHAPLIPMEEVTRARAATAGWTEPPTLEQVLAFPSAKTEKSP